MSGPILILFAFGMLLMMVKIINLIIRVESYNLGTFMALEYLAVYLYIL